MIAHLRGRERKLEPLGWTGQDAEWIALVCLHSGVFTRAQFCQYFDTDSKRAHRFVKSLLDRRAAHDGEWPILNGGAKTCRISSKAVYRALGVENIRHRRKATNPVVMRRLLSLDFVLEHPSMNWLPAEPEKVEFFEELGLPLRLIPRRIYYGVVGNQKRYFALKLPLAVTLKPSPLPTSIRATRRTGSCTRGEPRMGRFGMRSARRGGRFECSELRLKISSWTARGGYLKDGRRRSQGQAMKG